MKNKIYIAIICAFSIVFAVSSGFLIKHYCDSAKQAEMYDNLIEVVETEPEETTELMNYSEEKTFIPEYQELYLQNNDMVGWIKVEDTKINYPVMQSKDNPNFYLKHGFDKAYTDYGCPYVQENCDMELPSDNIIIYGHHMNDGSMFAGLMKFKDKSFWEKHKTVSFDTLTDRQTYEVIAVFKTVVYTDSPDSFKYYQFVNAETADDFTAYVERCKELSLYLLVTMYAKQYGLATRTDDEKMIGARIDAVIPELRLAFAFSQKGTDREAKVAEVLHFLCKAKRIQLFVIRQKDPIALATEIKQAFAKANLFINSDSQRDVAHLRKRYFAQKNNGN